MGRVNCTGLQKLDDAAAEQLRWGQGSRILRRRLPTDLVSASPAGCCAQRCYTEPRGRTGGGNEDWIWMLDKLRSGEWRAHGAKYDWRVAGLGACPRVANIALDGFGFGTAE